MDPFVVKLHDIMAKKVLSSECAVYRNNTCPLVLVTGILVQDMLPLLEPQGEGSNVSQAGSQAGAHLPSGEGGSFTQAGSQASQASQAVTSQPGTHLPLGEGSNSAASQASQAGALLPIEEGSRQAGTLLPPGEGSSSVPSHASRVGPHPHPARENSSQAGNNPPTSQSGSQVNRSSRQNSRHTARQRALQASQGISTSSQAGSTGTWKVNTIPNPPICSHKGLPQKSPTLSGSLTFPANL